MWNKGNQHIYPSIFRVAVVLLVFFEIVSGFLYADDFYQNPYFTYSSGDSGGILSFVREHIYIFLVFYAVVAGAFLLGIGRNLTAFLFFLCYTLELLLLQPYSFVGDRFLRTSLLFFVFVESFRYLSVNKLQPSWIPGNLSSLAILSIMIHTCLLYFANGIAKIRQQDWQEGRAMDYFFNFSSEMDIFGLDEKLGFMQSFFPWLGYLTIIFQLFFIVAIWFKPWKYIWIVMGILIHVFMAIILQLYKFEIIIILHFGFFLNDKEWKSILAFLKLNSIIKKTTV